MATFHTSRKSEDPVTTHPETARLAGIFAGMTTLADEIEEYLRDHLPRCQCMVCREVRRREEDLGGPYIRDQLTAVCTVLYSAAQLSEEARPMTSAEWNTLYEQFVASEEAKGDSP